MKRIPLIILLTAITLSGMAQTIGEAMYIYRNNGQINGFLTDEIQSIEYSYYDVDSIKYNEIVSQIVITADSIYQIPLAEIDSISFVTPQTEYQPDVINLSDQLMPYVVSSNELSITFSGSTPSDMMPRVGDKLVTLEMNEKFPAGFAGEVVSVSGSQVECKLVGLEEVFETYYGVFSTYGYQEGEQAISRRTVNSFGNKDFKLSTFTWSQNAELSTKLFGSDNLALKGGTQLSVGITPTFHIVSTLIINKEEGTYFSACVTGDMTFQEQISVYGGVEWSNDFLDKEWIKAPIAPLLFFYVKPGLFFKASATVSASATLTQRYKFGTAFDFSSKKQSVIKPSCDGHLADSSFDFEGSIDGSLSVGGFVELGLTVVSSDIDKLCFRGELGAELVGHAVLYNSDIAQASQETKVYERFKNSNIALNAFVSTSVQAELGPLGISYSLPWDQSYNIRTWDVVPTFSNTSFKQKNNPKTSADASVDMSGDCLFPVEVGLSVRNQNDEEITGSFANTKFTNGNKRYEHTFDNLNASEDFTLYPKVRLFGYEMLASPSVGIEKCDDFLVTLSDFKVTNSQYKEGGFAHDGVAYDYRFDVSVTATLDEDAEGIADWGYVYLDPNGKEAFISLKDFGNTYTDTRWAYFRNGTPPFTCMLYGYVKYVGSDETVYGEPHDYPLEYEPSYTSCPDGNHPHMIDLGLPSGTKWACCNVGASMPEEYGDYYAWGETQPKAMYNWETYAYCHKNDSVGYWEMVIENIGSDIAGTCYDAATANWGAPWRMPTKAQCDELRTNCSSVWTTMNGVNGRKFTGPNSGTIFLPAAGYREYWQIYDLAGSSGLYWSSTLYEDNSYAWHLLINSGGVDAYDLYRDEGMSVRPVR